jgi:hypothetical protein
LSGFAQCHKSCKDQVGTNSAADRFYTEKGASIIAAAAHPADLENKGTSYMTTASKLEQILAI